MLYPPTVSAPEKPLPISRVLIRFLRNPLTTLPRGAYEQPITMLRTGKRTAAWVSDPNLVEDMLVTRSADFSKSELEKRVFARTLRDGVLTGEGKLWRWQRRTMSPMFRAADILRYIPEMTEAAEDQIAAWRSAGGGLQQIDHDMVETTFAIIARTMLAGGLPAESAAIKRATATLLSGVTWEVAYGLMRLPRWAPHPATLRLVLVARRLRGAVGAIISRRQREGGSGEDLLGMLLAARDPDTNEPMDHDRLINNLLTLLEAGHETTSRALTWTLYLLARAPDWQERLRREIAEVAGGGPILAEHYPRLALTQQVLKESMRLYPPVPVMQRLVARDLTLGGEHLPKGAFAIVPIYAIHRHRLLWEDPDRFDPMRFTPEREAALPRCQFMPFGAGPRICLGAAFAMVEATVVLASFLRAARFDWDGAHSPEPVSRITLQPKGGMPLQVTMLDSARAEMPSPFPA
jgi:cytochrome P450